MSEQRTASPYSLALLAILTLLSAPAVPAQHDDSYAVAEPQIVIFSADELEVLVGPIALYPDDLLAIVLPASTYPLQVVQAARFLDDLRLDGSLQPDEAWDESIVALLNYPEALQLLNEDLDWTWDLGGAVVNQQPDVIDAIETFRDKAYVAGNLETDAYQRVEYEDDTLRITPVRENIIHVPYYEPERVVVYQREPVYYYYPRAYPVYYYPYPATYAFRSGFFWGVASAYAIAWHTRYVHVHRHHHPSHPYFGRDYRNDYYHHDRDRRQSTRERRTPRDNASHRNRSPGQIQGDRDTPRTARSTPRVRTITTDSGEDTSHRRRETRVVAPKPVRVASATTPVRASPRTNARPAQHTDRTQRDSSEPRTTRSTTARRGQTATVKGNSQRRNSSRPDAGNARTARNDREPQTPKPARERERPRPQPAAQQRRASKDEPDESKRRRKDKEGKRQ